MQEWNFDLPAEAAALAPHAVELRRAFHAHPELGGREFETARRIEAELDALGIPHRRCGETGVWATLQGRATASVTTPTGGEGAARTAADTTAQKGPSGAASGVPVVALRADIDALPIEEHNAFAWRSACPGVMHACGHDAHVACLLTAARLLAAHTDSFCGEVRLLFQPGEEIGIGVQPFVEAGALAGVRRLFGLHVDPKLPVGKVGLKAGLNNASVDHFTVRIQGVAAHVSTPHLGVDALYIASQLVVALQALVTRRSSPVEPLLIGVGKLSAGTAYNAVAEAAVLEGTTRTVSHAARARTRALLEGAATATAALYGGSATVEWEDFASPLLNPADVTAELTAPVAALWGAERIVTDRELSLAGDNFADLQLHAPGVYAYLGSGDPAQPGTCNPQHNNNFDVAEAALPFGAGLYATAALHWLRPGLLSPSHPVA